MDSLSVNSGTSATSASQARAKAVAVGFPPMGLRHHCQRDGRMLHRADQANPAFDLAIVEHQARAGTCTAARPGLAVDQKHRAGIGEALSASSA